MSERQKASDYPQELLDLFHEYQHGDVNRRAFLDRAAKFAVGGLSAIAILDQLSPNYLWAQQVPKDDKDIVVSSETIASPKGNGTINGYFVKPAKMSGKLPAVLVIHENRGRTPYIEDVARRLTKANFIALAPDGLTSVGREDQGGDADPPRRNGHAPRRHVAGLRRRATTKRPRSSRGRGRSSVQQISSLRQSLR